MNIHVHTAEGIATICGDVIYDINDQIVEPFREIHDAEPRTTGNHGTSKRAEKGGDQEASQQLALSAAGARPPGARSRAARWSARLQDQVPGPIVQCCPSATGSRCKPSERNADR